MRQASEVALVAALTIQAAHRSDLITSHPFRQLGEVGDFAISGRGEATCFGAKCSFNCRSDYALAQELRPAGSILRKPVDEKIKKTHLYDRSLCLLAKFEGFPYEHSTVLTCCFAGKGVCPTLGLIVWEVSDRGPRSPKCTTLLLLGASTSESTSHPCVDAS